MPVTAPNSIHVTRLSDAAPSPPAPPTPSQPIPFPDIDSDSILAVQSRPLDWLWPRRIPLGKITLLAGDPGLGKSMLSLDIAARLSRPTPFPDAPVPITNHQSPITNDRPATTLLLSAEDDPADTIRPRLEAAGANLANIKLFHPDESLRAFSPFSLVDAENLGILEMLVQAQDNCRLVIIDPISAYLGNCSATNNNAVRRALAPLAQLAATCEIAILAITHLRKSNTTRAICRAMDSLAFAAASRSVWFLTADPADRTRRIFSAAKANLAREAPTLAFRIADNRLVWETESLPLTADDALSMPRPDPHANSDRKQAMLWLTELLTPSPLPIAHVLDLARKLGFSPITLRRAREDLALITTRQGFGPQSTCLWRLPPCAAGAPTGAPSS